MEVYNQDSNQRPRLSVGEWVLTLFLVGIPLIGLIMLCIWAFGGKNDERENFASKSIVNLDVNRNFNYYCIYKLCWRLSFLSCFSKFVII